MSRHAVRLPKPKAERYIDGTMCSFTTNEVILREKKSQGSIHMKWKRAKTEDVIETILEHEFIHLVVFKVEGELVSLAMDKISGWNTDKPEIEFGKVVTHK